MRIDTNNPKANPMHEHEKADRHRAVFGEYVVTGFEHNDSSGRRGWHINSRQSSAETGHDYWVSGRDFHAVRDSHFHYRDRRVELVEIYEPAITKGIEQAEQDAVLQAIARWEKIGSSS
jgi:hypothetical protein